MSEEEKKERERDIGAETSDDTGSADGGKMSFAGHLDELRRRVILCLLATFGAMFAAYAFYNPWLLNLLRGPLDSLAGRSVNPFVLDTALIRFLKESLEESQRAHLDLRFVGLLEPLLVKLKASFLAGAILASPVIFYQIWRFASIGLTKNERRTVRVFFPASLTLFLVGVLLAYFVMLPVVVYFLVAGGGAGLTPMLTINLYVAPVAFACLGFGLVFQLPLAILILTRLGIVSPQLLKAKRKYAILIMFIVGAILTPPDVVTQVMLALPMIALYELSILLSYIVWLRRRKKLEE